jgi:IMP dehydrogenase
MAEISLGLSFDDVLLVPQHSAVIPNETKISSWLTKNIGLNIPVISAAMDSVSEADLAMALAREGGIGVIHRNNTIEEQAAMVSKVKRSENAVIYDPYTVTRNMNVAQIRQIMHDQGFAGFPVVAPDRKLEGMVTERDVRHSANEKRNVSELMTPLDRLNTAPAKNTIEEPRRILYENRIE